MNSGFLKVSSQDFLKGALTAVVAGVLFALYGVVSQSGFDLFTVDWVEIGRIAVNAGFAAFIGYMGTSLGTTKEGKFLGAVKVK